MDGDDFGGFDYLFHLGACSATTERDAAFLGRNNYEYTKNLAALGPRTRRPLRLRLTAATYGALEEDLSDEADLASCAR